MDDGESNRPIGRRAAIAGVAGLALLLAGCGRKSAPKPPEGATYQTTPYPTRPAMGLPKDSPLASPPPADETDDADEDRRPVGAYSAPPPGMRY